MFNARVSPGRSVLKLLLNLLLKQFFKVLLISTVTHVCSIRLLSARKLLSCWMPI